MLLPKITNNSLITPLIIVFATAKEKTQIVQRLSTKELKFNQKFFIYLFTDFESIPLNVSTSSEKH